MDARRRAAGFTLEELAPEERDKMLALAVRYLNLSSEEYFLFRKGVIDEQTWTIWQNEIFSALRRRWLLEAWRELKSEYNSFPEFSALIEAIIADKASTVVSAQDDRVSRSG